MNGKVSLIAISFIVIVLKTPERLPLFGAPLFVCNEQVKFANMVLSECPNFGAWIG